MTVQQDVKIRELGSCKLAIRGDLVWTPQMSSGQRYYLVEDPLSARFYRIGTAEYTFISLLDGQTTMLEARNLTAAALPHSAFTEQEAVTICHWLLENSLLRTSERATTSNRPPAENESAVSRLQRWNPLILRLPLLHPDRFFEALSPWVRWLFSTSAFAGWAVLGLIAAFQIANEWDAVLASFVGVFAPGNWAWLPLCWLGLKIVHELAHGAACKHFGGTVREAGVILILFLPVTYVDVSSSWRFRSKWHRVITAAAGMYAELFVAGVATLLWSHTSLGLFHNLCFNVIIMASLTTLVFNANFLMRYDGYFMVSDALEIPNLATVAQQQLTRLALTPFFCGGPMPAGLPPSRAKRFLVTCFGLASFCWRILVCACLIIAATAMFQGAGKILALLAAVLWLGIPVVQLLKRILRMRHQNSGVRSLSFSTLGLAMVVAALLAVEVPWPLPPQAPTVVEYAKLGVIRADSPGFVEAIHVHDGQMVTDGQVLAVLRNEELALELADLEYNIEQSETKCRVLEHAREMAAWQAETKQLETLQQKHQEKAEQFAHLTLRAPTSGRVIGLNLQNLLGVYLKPGDEILSIGDEQHKELQVAISQEQLPAFQDNVHHPAHVRLPGGRVFLCELSSIDPRASLDCPHPALSGANGGPLAVRAKVEKSHDLGNGEERVELLVPHFIGRLSLTSEWSDRLRTGQVGVASLPAHREAVGSFFYHTLARWIQRQIQRATPQRTT